MIKAFLDKRRKSKGQKTWMGLPDQRIYAIGDVHGCSDLLSELISIIENDNRQRKTKPTSFVFLGDLIDRGPNSRGVIETGMRLADFGMVCEFLKGNHEAMMLEALLGEDLKLIRPWLRYGGEECLESYGVNTKDIWSLDNLSIRKVMRDAIPNSHVDFLKSFGLYYEFGDYLLVHAGVNPKKDLKAQKEVDYLWSREPFLSWSGEIEKKIIHGHTISEKIEICSHRIGIDTGAYLTGRLSALRIEGDEMEVLQAQRL